MVLTVGARLGKNSYVFLYKKQPVEIVDRYPYSGVTLSTSALSLVSANSAVNKAILVTSSALTILAMAKGDSWEATLKLFNSVVASMLLYTAPVRGLRHTSILEKRNLTFLNVY